MKKTKKLLILFLLSLVIVKSSATPSVSASNGIELFENVIPDYDI